MSARPAAQVPAPASPVEAPLSPRADAAARLNAAVIERLEREGVPIPPAPSHSP